MVQTKWQHVVGRYPWRSLSTFDQAASGTYYVPLSFACSSNIPSNQSCWTSISANKHRSRKQTHHHPQTVSCHWYGCAYLRWTQGPNLVSLFNHVLAHLGSAKRGKANCLSIFCSRTSEEGYELDSQDPSERVLVDA